MNRKNSTSQTDKFWNTFTKAEEFRRALEKVTAEAFIDSQFETNLIDYNTEVHIQFNRAFSKNCPGVELLHVGFFQADLVKYPLSLLFIFIPDQYIMCIHLILNEDKNGELSWDFEAEVKISTKEDFLASVKKRQQADKNNN